LRAKDKMKKLNIKTLTLTHTNDLQYLTYFIQL
jgi:hypothetical protein